MAQILISLLLLPYQLATTFFGVGKLGAAADVVAELEGSVIDTVAWTNEDGGLRPSRSNQRAIGRRMPKT